MTGPVHGAKAYRRLHSISFAASLCFLAKHRIGVAITAAGPSPRPRPNARCTSPSPYSPHRPANGDQLAQNTPSTRHWFLVCSPLAIKPAPSPPPLQTYAHLASWSNNHSAVQVLLLLLPTSGSARRLAAASSPSGLPPPDRVVSDGRGTQRAARGDGRRRPGRAGGPRERPRGHRARALRRRRAQQQDRKTSSFAPFFLQKKKKK